MIQWKGYYKPHIWQNQIRLSFKFCKWWTELVNDTIELIVFETEAEKLNTYKRLTKLFLKDNENVWY